MMRPNESQPVDLNTRDVICPECRRSAHVEVVVPPDPVSWFGRNGTAVCTRCSIQFNVTITEET
jgi:transcription elongation factor Elf1